MEEAVTPVHYSGCELAVSTPGEGCPGQADITAASSWYPAVQNGQFVRWFLAETFMLCKEVRDEFWQLLYWLDSAGEKAFLIALMDVET